MFKVNIELTATAQYQIRDAIKWRSRSEGEDGARDKVKSAITNWQAQLETLPQSGKVCEQLNSPEYRELINGDYRFIYEIRESGEQFNIYLLIFCHVRMDYQTLLKHISHY